MLLFVFQYHIVIDFVSLGLGTYGVLLELRL